jgi:Spy/CpxP family protein refolding chaperone
MEDSSMKRAHVLAAALAALLLVPALAEARDRRASPEEILRNPRLLARYLKLTEAQQAQAEPLFTALNNSLRAIHEQEKTVREQLAAELAKPSPDACTAGGYVVQIKGFATQAAAALRTFDTAFSAILTPEQLAKYNALKELAGRGGRG